MKTVITAVNENEDGTATVIRRAVDADGFIITGEKAEKTSETLEKDKPRPKAEDIVINAKLDRDKPADFKAEKVEAEDADDDDEGFLTVAEMREELDDLDAEQPPAKASRAEVIEALKAARAEKNE